MNFSEYLQSISGVAIYPMFSLLVFVIFFIVLSIRVFRMKKEEIIELENMPLNDSITIENK